MNITDLLNILHTAEKLKDTTRHSYTSGGRHESVAEHSYRLALMAYFIKDEFLEADIDKVIKMCLLHDIGEAFTGDIPAFEKTSLDEENEKRLLLDWVNNLPDPYNTEMIDLYREMETRQTLEAKLFKALDGLEAVIQHNEADLLTWSDNEYEVNLTYAEDKCEFSPYLRQLRTIIKNETVNKIENIDRGDIMKTIVKFYETVDDSLLKFAVIVAKSNGKWVFCKHKERNTYECPGGHREVGENIDDTAKRELYEETGAIDYTIQPVCVYSVTAPNHFDGKETFGKLYYAEIKSFEGKLYSEIERVELFDDLPSSWTYPQIQPILLKEVAQRRNLGE